MYNKVRKKGISWNSITKSYAQIYEAFFVIINYRCVCQSSKVIIIFVFALNVDKIAILEK